MFHFQQVKRRLDLDPGEGFKTPQHRKSRAYSNNGTTSGLTSPSATSQSPSHRGIIYTLILIQITKFYIKETCEAIQNWLVLGLVYDV